MHILTGAWIFLCYGGAPVIILVNRSEIGWPLYIGTDQSIGNQRLVYWWVFIADTSGYTPATPGGCSPCGWVTVNVK
jgi:hypothetical protein